MSALRTTAPCWSPKTPLYKVLRCLHTHAVRASSLPPQERTLPFAGGRKTTFLSTFFSSSPTSWDLLRLLTDDFCANLLPVWRGLNCLPGAERADGPSLYNAERSSLSSLSVYAQRWRTAGSGFYGFPDWLIDSRFIYPPPLPFPNIRGFCLLSSLVY